MVGSMRENGNLANNMEWVDIIMDIKLDKVFGNRGKD